MHETNTNTAEIIVNLFILMTALNKIYRKLKARFDGRFFPFDQATFASSA